VRAEAALSVIRFTKKPSSAKFEAKNTILAREVEQKMSDGGNTEGWDPWNDARKNEIYVCL
jgi:hypothetical protein